MSRIHKVLLTSLSVVLVLILTWLLYTMNMRSEFNAYLTNKYPEQKFAVGIVKYDPLYGNYFADVTCEPCSMGAVLRWESSMRVIGGGVG